MMERELQEKVLNEMFVIKAGISIIADENDKIEKVKAQIAENQKTLQNNKYTIENFKKSMESLDNNRKKEQKEMADVFLKVGMRLGGLLVAVALAVVGFIVGASLFAQDTSLEAGKGLMGIVFMAISTIVIVVAPPFVLFSKNRTRLSSAFSYKQNIDDRNDCYKDYARRLKETEAHTQLTESEASYLQTKLRCQINESTPVVQGTYKFLIDNCRNYITELHFDKVDLIIYYVYSGLADTVKEALQEVQKDMRNEELLNELRNQGSMIRQSIESGFNMLASTINYNFSQLGSQLAKQHNEAMAKMGSIGSDISSKLSDIEAGQKLQSSLSASINKSSIEAGKSLRNIEEHIRLYNR